MRSTVSGSKRPRSEDGVIILKDLLREKDPETYEWLFGKRRRRSASSKKTS